MPPFVTYGIIIVAVIALIVLIFFLGYVKASPDTAYIISGLRKKPKVLIGKAGVKIPFLEKKDELNLQLIPIDVKTSSAVPTADYINIRVDAAVNVKISDKPDRLNLAAQNFLNRKPDYIANVAQQVLEGNMREIVGKMNLEEMVSDRQKFATLVKENAEPDLAAMGLDIVSFNVQNFVDNNSVIENLGVDNIVKIQKNAAISRAESEKEIAKAQAVAKKEANDAEIAANTEIAMRENELAIKRAELKKSADVKQAEADAAYKIQEQEQRRSIEIASANANLARQEKEIELKAKEVEIAERNLEANVKKKAEADKFAMQQRSDADLYARKKEAEAKKFEAEQEAEAQKAKADAHRFEQEQVAVGIEKVGLAEAEAIRQKGLAEAEAMEKKAEAYQKYNNAAVAQMLIQVLPEVAEKIAEPLEKIDKITVIDGGGTGTPGLSSIAGNVPVVMSKLFETMNDVVGIDLKKLIAPKDTDKE